MYLQTDSQIMKFQNFDMAKKLNQNFMTKPKKSYPEVFYGKFIVPHSDRKGEHEFFRVHILQYIIFNV